jgi:hypothetical protein
MVGSPSLLTKPERFPARIIFLPRRAGVHLPPEWSAVHQFIV